MDRSQSENKEKKLKKIIAFLVTNLSLLALRLGGARARFPWLRLCLTSIGQNSKRPNVTVKFEQSSIVPTIQVLLAYV